MRAWQLLPAVRDLFSKRPEYYYHEACELQHILYPLSYTDDLADELVRVKEGVHRLKEKVEEDGDLRTALLGCDKALKALELQAKVEQLIQSPPTVNILMTPEWVSLRTRLIYALDAYPEARGSVIRALEGGGNGTA
jgi:hypothetical protein